MTVLLSTVFSALFQEMAVMSNHLGIDTSNYTTSVSVFSEEDNKIYYSKKLLPVKMGECGLRQSDAVFHHTIQLPEVMDDLFKKFDGNISSVGVSVSPRDEEGSYMPCFMTGLCVAESLSKVNNIPLNRFSHQAGHIMAALYSSDSMELIDKSFIAFHLSGGTTEALLVTPDKGKIFNIELIAHSLDLKAGQAVDRVGVMLGLQFPCGKEVDKLAQLSHKSYKVKPVMKDENCCLSGLENICKKMKENGEKSEDICNFCISYIEATLKNMTEKLIMKYGNLPLVYAGGVMSNSIIRKSISSQFAGRFASHDFSSKNASGTALLSFYKEKLK